MPSYSIIVTGDIDKVVCELDPIDGFNGPICVGISWLHPFEVFDAFRYIRVARFGPVNGSLRS